MPRVHHRKARKDYPNVGIAKGDMYYTWKIKLARGGITYRSKTAPRRSQLTLSDFLGQAYDLDDSVSEAEDADALRQIAEDVRTLGEEQQEKLDNMPDQLQESDSGQLIQERIDGCEQWADELESAADQLEQDLESIDDDEEGYEPPEGEEARDFDAEREEALNNARDSGAMQF